MVNAFRSVAEGLEKALPSKLKGLDEPASRHVAVSTVSRGKRVCGFAGIEPPEIRRWQ